MAAQHPAAGGSVTPLLLSPGQGRYVVQVAAGTMCSPWAGDDGSPGPGSHTTKILCNQTLAYSLRIASNHQASSNLEKNVKCRSQIHIHVNNLTVSPLQQSIMGCVGCEGGIGKVTSETQWLGVQWDGKRRVWNKIKQIVCGALQRPTLETEAQWI